MKDSSPYQFTPYENELIKRLTFNTFLKSKEFNFTRYPQVFWIPEERRFKRMDSYNYDSRPEYKNQVYDNPDKIYDIDLMGCYIFNSDGGYIELYQTTIEESSTRISRHLNLSFEEVIELLQAIVLIHELGHWFSHACFVYNGYNRRIAFQCADSEIIETIAQLAVIWSTMGLKDEKTQNLLRIMDFLTTKQSYPYRQYIKLKKHYSKKIRILNRYIKLLDYYMNDLDYLLFEKPNLEIEIMKLR
jgi:hypothetical protein